MKGAAVEVHFAYSHVFFKKKNTHYYSGMLRRMKIIQAVSAVPSSPFKCIHVSASPGKGKGRAYYCTISINLSPHVTCDKA